jgi:gamma-glutamyltranspeptidase/glutathione hydrolase
LTDARPLSPAAFRSPRMLQVARIAFVAVAVLLAPLPLRAQDARVVAPAGSVAPVTVRHGMVVAQEARAARVGVEILRKGGNAVDAAVAVGFALAATYPRAGNIGGGGFMLIHLARRRQSVAVDYRETAPAATTRDVFLDARGEADPAKSRDSGLAVGVPGTVAGLALAHARYGSGKFTLARLIAPAIRFAKGIPVEDDIADTLPRAQPRLASWRSSAAIFLKPDGTALRAGDMLVQNDLAATLSAIARHGPSAFYRGPIAEKIAAAVRAAGGLMTVEDLNNYRAVVREPVRNTYRGHAIVSMPPPSSGGVQLIEMLNVLEGFSLGELEAASSLHLMIEAMKRA